MDNGQFGEKERKEHLRIIRKRVIRFDSPRTLGKSKIGTTDQGAISLVKQSTGASNRPLVSADDLFSDTSVQCLYDCVHLLTDSIYHVTWSVYVVFHV
jgi:hypothetical protein